MKYLQGRYTPLNPQKYVGDVSNICFRSSWELKMFKWCDENTNIIKWASEEMFIPYVSPIDNRIHRYFVDLTIQYRTASNEIKQAIVEIKPEKQTIMPTSKRRTKHFLTEMTTYMINQAKWDAAKAWAKKQNWDFIILTEKHLGIK